jgi:hypothetical protein
MRIITGLALACATAALGAAAAHAGGPVAPRPPMGWNSWDAYGFTLDEDQFKANAEAVERLKGYGWRYVVIDEGWYMRKPLGDKLETRDYQLDHHGRLIPDAARFPSAADGRGFRTLAAWTHARGLKFGLHIVRGIPKQAVEGNLPIEGSSFRALDGADKAATCGWDDGNYGVADNAAGQAYYDSVIRMYASWGLDFLKVDCVVDHPYRPTEIRQIAEAIRKTGRPIVLSLSPGPTRLSHAEEVRRYAEMWRIANDVWDGWDLAHRHSDDDFPNGVRPFFDLLPAWNRWSGQGRWPDADMLPIGSLRPHPGWGEPRQSRLTPDEARTLFSLWAIARSPLILGANLNPRAGDQRRGHRARSARGRRPARRSAWRQPGQGARLGLHAAGQAPARHGRGVQPFGRAALCEGGLDRPWPARRSPAPARHLDGRAPRACRRRRLRGGSARGEAAARGAGKIGRDRGERRS